MKIINMKQLFYLVFAGILAISCGEDAFNPYSPNPLADNDGAISYTNLTTYPVVGDIVSQAPEYSVEGAYKFIVHEVEAPTGSTFKLANFTADALSGVITYKNEGELSSGDYNVKVGVNHVNGLAVYDNAYVLTVLDVPVEGTIDNPVVDAGIFQAGVVATVSYTDTSGSGLITSVEYKLVDATTGFSIDKNSGEISKSDVAASGPNNITVKITTNLGAIIEENICVINVGEAPTLDYVQADGTTLLTNVVMSPWTAYTSAAPNLVGMIATNYDIILPAELVEGTIVANADGTIAVLADQNFAEGRYSLGVVVTNAGGNEVTFEDVFSITVETRWEVDAPVFFEDFNNAVDPPEVLNDYNAALTSYMLNSGIFDFKAAYTSSKGVYTAKLGEGKVGGNFESPSDGTIVLELAMQADWRKMRVSFNEGFGYSDNRIGWYERTLQSSHDITDLISGTYDDSNWTTMMSDTDTDWSGTSVWKGLSSDNDLNKVGFKDVELTQGSAAVYLNWRVQKTGTATGGAAFLVDDIRVEVSLAFEAEEQ